MSILFTTSGSNSSRSDTSIAAASPSTVSMWFNLSTTADVVMGEVLFTGGYEILFRTFGGSLLIVTGDGIGGGLAYSGTAISTGTWVHCVIVNTSTQATIYLNGAQVATAAFNIAARGASSNWVAGWSSAASNSTVQDFAIYNAALSADEAVQLYRARNPKRRTNLLAYYPFFVGSRTVDYSGNAKTLTEANTPGDGALQAAAGWGTLSPRILPAAGGAVSIAGTGATVANGSGVVTVDKAVGATGATVANGSGVLALVKAVAGTGATVANGTGTLALSKALAATGATVVDGTGTVLPAGSLAGSGATVANGAGNLSVAKALAAVGATVTNGAGALSANLVVLAGVGSTITNATGILSLSKALAGTGATVTNGFGLLTGGGSGPTGGGAGRGTGYRRRATTNRMRRVIR